MLDDAGPGPEQLVSFPVLPAFEAVVPRRVTPEAPDKLAAAALDLPHREKKLNTHAFTSKCPDRRFSTGDRRADLIGSQLKIYQGKNVTVDNSMN